jgi:hypothetical protein
MQGGELQRAWQISDRSLQEYRASGAVKHSGERHLQRIWRGEDLRDKRVLVRCYHGLGDTIQFVRFAKPLRLIAREVILWVQPELLDLLHGADGVDQLHPLHDGTPDFPYDVDIEIMELAHALRATPDMIASRVPYLACGSAERLAGDSQISIGLVWEVGNWDRRRCVPARKLSPLGTVPGIRLCSLQQGAGRDDAAIIPAKDSAVADLRRLAATIMGLDLVITVDTMVAHLAGALGARVWTMLHAECDWRWPKAGRDSLWYPCMRLFHQSRSGDWDSVLDEMVRELRKYASDSGDGRWMHRGCLLHIDSVPPDYERPRLSRWIDTD